MWVSLREVCNAPESSLSRPEVAHDFNDSADLVKNSEGPSGTSSFANQSGLQFRTRIATAEPMPTSSSRAFALVHLAVCAIEDLVQSFAVVPFSCADA